MNQALLTPYFVVSKWVSCLLSGWPGHNPPREELLFYQRGILGVKKQDPLSGRQCPLINPKSTPQSCFHFSLRRGPEGAPTGVIPFENPKEKAWKRGDLGPRPPPGLRRQISPQILSFLLLEEPPLRPPTAPLGRPRLLRSLARYPPRASFILNESLGFLVE